MPYVIIEGGEGTGKGTLVRLLKEQYPNAVFVAEPGTTKKAQEIRAEIMEHPEYSEIKKTQLFAQARKSLMNEIVRPALDKGNLVISDRSWISSAVYQSSITLSMEDIIAYNKESSAFEKPDGVIWLNLSPEKALARIKSNGRETNYFDELPLTYHMNIQSKYTALLSELDSEVVELKDVLDIKSSLKKVTDLLDKYKKKTL